MQHTGHSVIVSILTHSCTAFCPGPRGAVLRAYQGGRHGRHRGRGRAAGLPARRGRRVAQTPRPGPGRSGPAGWARCSGRLCRAGHGMWGPRYRVLLVGAYAAAGHSSVPLLAQIAATMHMRLPQQPSATAHAPRARSTIRRRGHADRTMVSGADWRCQEQAPTGPRLLTQQDDAAACGQQRLHAALQRLPHHSQARRAQPGGAPCLSTKRCALYALMCDGMLS